MLDQQNGNAEHVTDTDDIVHQLARLRWIHTGRRLVEQQQARIGRQRADDLKPPLCAVGQRTSLVVGQILHIENAQQLQRTFLCDALPPPVFRQAQDRRRGAVLHLIVQSNQDVVQHAQLAEQADILEGAGNAHVIHLNG